jgi:signal transduction histidine kinase
MGFDNPEKVIGKSDFDFFPKELAHTRFNQEQKIIRTGQPLLNLEETDGLGHWALTSKMPLRDENGKIIGTFGFTHDITEMKLAQAELVRKERLSALGQLIATVAHEIRNPLGTILTCIFTIGDAIDKNKLEHIKRALQLAERNITRCDTIINELLDFTRDWTLQCKPTNIDEWLNSILDELLELETIPESITCIKDLNTDIKISIDAEHLRRAVINIINNGVDAIKECNKKENQLTIKTNISDKKLIICIKDTGCGIPENIMDKLFEPLFSTKSFGIGLGLSIVKNIMEQYDGGIEIKSHVDKGTSVSLWFPIKNKKGD